MITPPSLPEEKVDNAPVWTNTGVDYAGPLYIMNKHLSSSEGSTTKTYVSLFTCASTRAVHMALVEAASAKQFLHAFRRFISRRGVPKVILSDNAKNFKSSSKEIQNMGRSEVEQDHMANLGTE